MQSLALERSRTAIKEKIAKKEKKKEKKKKRKHLSTSDSESALNMSEIEASESANGGAAIGSDDIPDEMRPSDTRLRQDSQELNEENERSRKPREPAIVFKDIEVNNV